MSKKDALILVVLGVGGVAAASAFAEGKDGGEGGSVMAGLRGVKGRAGGILGSTTSPTVYQFAAQPAVSFPATPSFDLSSLFPSETPVARGAAGVSSASKKIPVTPTKYVYTGGEIKTGAVSVAPWAMGRTTPAEMGVTTAISVARGGVGTSKKKSTFSSKSYQKGYQARASKRYAAARAKRITARSKKENNS